MTERRFDPFTHRFALIAPGRRGLGAAKPDGPPKPGERCPFCPGHEADTEETVQQWPAEGPWQTRVVANKYPIVDDSFASCGGIHEVVVEAREHDATLATMKLEPVLELYRARVRELSAIDSIAAVLIFRNRGRRAGSSQPHPHSQIAATSWVPSEVALRWSVALDHLRDHSESVHAAELRREIGSERELRVGEHIATFCPYAPTRPFEVRFAPLAPSGGFGDATDAQLDELASHLGDVARRFEERTPITDFNLVLRQPPARAEGPAAAWHLELLPRTGGDAGYELAGGEMIVVVTPEESAATLRG